MAKTPQALLQRIGLSEAEISIYSALLSKGAMSANELVRVSGGKRPTVYYAIRQLLDRGLVREIPSSGVKRFQAEPPESIHRMLDTRAMELDQIRLEVDEMLPFFKATTAGIERPHVTFIEGVNAMKQAVMETLYIRSRHIDTIAPKDNFFWQIGQEFSQAYIDERVRRKITTRNLWEEPLKPEILTRSYKGRSNIRIMPSMMHGKFSSTVFIYDDTVMYISSVSSAYIVRIQSAEHAAMMRAIYDGLWEGSREVS